MDPPRRDRTLETDENGVPKVAGDGVIDLDENKDSVSAMALQADGKIVAVGNVSGKDIFFLVRFGEDGQLDPSFGKGGKVLVSEPPGCTAYAVMVQPDQRIVIAGTQDGSSLLARYSPSGKPDPTFGGGKGYALGGIGSGMFNAVVRQPDGKLIASGGSSGKGFVTARFLEDGSPDVGFGVGGMVAVFDSTFPSAPGLKLQKDGKIVVAGTIASGLYVYDYQLGLARLDPDGALDTTFGVGGTLVMGSGMGGWAGGNALDLQADGKMVVAGRLFFEFAEDSAASVMRLDKAGGIDASFTGIGMYTTDVVGSTDLFNSVVVQPDGAILAAGLPMGKPAVMRLRADGTLDAHFGQNGFFSPVKGGGELTSLVLLPKGSFVVAGAWGRRAYVARATAGGTLDETFGTKGRVFFDAFPSP